MTNEQLNQLLGSLDSKALNKTSFGNLDIRMIDVDETENIRHLYNNIDELAASIKEAGLRDPLKVAEYKAENGEIRYKLVDGFRRMRAIRMLHEQGVPFKVVRVQKVKNSMEEKLLEMLITGLHKDKVHPVEEAEGIAELVSRFGWSQTDVAKKMGKTPAHISNMVKLGAAPMKLKKLCLEGTIGYSAILKALSEAEDDHDKAIEIVESIVAENTTVTETGETVVKKVKGSQVKGEKTKRITPMALLALASDKMAQEGVDTSKVDTLIALLKDKETTVEKLVELLK
jgi:ParB family chromosome partitioning protein